MEGNRHEERTVGSIAYRSVFLAAGLLVITILVEELWMKPMEEAHRRAGESAILRA